MPQISLAAFRRRPFEPRGASVPAFASCLRLPRERVFMANPTAVRAQESPDSSTSTLGLAPPPGAVVLFDGSNFDAWKPFSFLKINPNDDQKEIQWKFVDGQAMEITFEFEGKPRKQFLCTRRNSATTACIWSFGCPRKAAATAGSSSGRCTSCRFSTAQERRALDWATAARSIRSVCPM